MDSITSIVLVTLPPAAACPAARRSPERPAAAQRQHPRNQQGRHETSPAEVRRREPPAQLGLALIARRLSGRRPRRARVAAAGAASPPAASEAPAGAAWSRAAAAAAAAAARPVAATLAAAASLRESQRATRPNSSRPGCVAVISSDSRGRGGRGGGCGASDVRHEGPANTYPTFECD